MTFFQANRPYRLRDHPILGSIMVLDYESSGSTSTALNDTSCTEIHEIPSESNLESETQSHEP